MEDEEATLSLRQTGQRGGLREAGFFQKTRLPFIFTIFADFRKGRQMSRESRKSETDN
jgi:hypothetical protein